MVEFFTRSEYIKLHFAESWNELHHLLIMEELGGDSVFLDRFVAQHIAFVYYWLVVALYILSPATAYDLNMNVEQHAYDTYDGYLKDHEEELRNLPAPKVAKEYYETGDLGLFDAFQWAPKKEDTDAVVATGEHKRRPVIRTLYDVFWNIREDEAEHASSMRKLRDFAVNRNVEEKR